MIPNPQVLATINLLLQAVLLGTALFAVYQAKDKRLLRHCRIMRWAVLGQLALIILIMLPSFLGYIKISDLPFRTEIILHHSLGFAVILLWVYANLAVTGRVRTIGQLVWYMRTALSLWIAAFLLGVYLYIRIYFMA